MPSDELQYDIEHSIPVLMINCVKLIREGLTKHFEEAGYTVTTEQWALLLHLWEEDGISQQALANRYHRSKVATLKLLERMEKNGLVTRKPDPSDGRSNVVRLTEEGRSLKHVLVPLALANIENMTRGVSEEELETLRGIINKFATNLKQ